MNKVTYRKDVFLPGNAKYPTYHGGQILLVCNTCLPALIEKCESTTPFPLVYESSPVKIHPCAICGARPEWTEPID